MPVELYSNEYFGLCAIGGILSCGLTHTAVTPLDLVKCNMQANPKEFTGTFQGFGKIYREGGFKGLRLGWGPTLAGYSVQGMFKFGLYEVSNTKKHTHTEREWEGDTHRTHTQKNCGHGEKKKTIRAISSLSLSLFQTWFSNLFYLGVFFWLGMFSFSSISMP